VLVFLAALPILACVPLTRAQVSYWQNSVALFEHTLRWTSNNFLIEHDLGKVLMKMGKLEAAREHMSEAVKILPGEPQTHLGLGRVLMEQKKFAEAADQLALALQLSTNSSKACAMLGVVLVEVGKPEAAVGRLSEAMRMDPTNADIRCYAAMALDRSGRVQEAVAQYREALRLNPRLPAALNNLAWILASNPNPEIRNGQEAVLLAEQACRLNWYRDPALLGTLGAAYAEAGRFDEAVEMANRAAALATAAGNRELAEKSRTRAELFRSRQPWREGGGTPGTPAPPAKP
jgi:Flp pilus assembly protein TadD